MTRSEFLDWAVREAIPENVVQGLRLDRSGRLAELATIIYGDEIAAEFKFLTELAL